MSKKMKYIIKNCPSDDTQALQNLLNEMSMNGWELYSMTEVEVDDKLMFNCIFMIEEDTSKDTDSSDIISWGTVRNPIEKMLSPEMTPYEKCVELIGKIKEQKKKIARIKSALDVEAPASVGRKEYNDKISSSLKEFEALKKDLANMANSNGLYDRLGVDDLCLKVSEELIPIIDTDSEENENLFPELVKMRYSAVDEYGYIIPPLRILDSEILGAYEFQIDVRGVEVFKATAYPTHEMFFTEDLNLDKKMKDAIYDVDNITGREIVWIDKNNTKDYWANGMSAVEYITRAINFIAVRYADELFDYDTLLKYCEIVENSNPFLLENLVPDTISFADLRYILTSLITERVSIKDITFIFSKLNDFADDSTREDLLNKIRLSLSRSICSKYADETNTISALELSDKTLERILPTIDEADAIVKIDASFAEKLAKKFIKVFDENEMTLPILVVPMEYRQILFNLLVHFINDITVISREEIGSNCKLEIVEEI